MPIGKAYRGDTVAERVKWARWRMKCKYEKEERDNEDDDDGSSSPDFTLKVLTVEPVSLRKTACTASLFLAIVGLLVAGWFVRLPDYMGFSGGATLPGLLWADVYVLMPLLVIGVAVGALYGVWVFSVWACEKLRELI